MNYLPLFNSAERRLSQAYLPPKIELVQEDDGRHEYKCTAHSSPFEDSDSAASGRSRRGRGKHPRRKQRKWLVDGFMVAGAAMSALLLALACFTFLVGDWVLTGLAEVLGFFSLLGGAYLGSSVLYSLWSTQCSHSAPLNSRTVALMAGSYFVGAVCCNLVDLLLLPTLPLNATFLVLLAGWLSATNAYLHKDTAAPDQFIRQPENYLFVAVTIVHRLVVQAVFHAFIPAFFLPLIVHSCHLFGLTVALLMQGGRSRRISREVSTSSVASKRRPSLRSSVLYPPPLRLGVRHSSLERRTSWTSISSIGSSRVSNRNTHTTHTNTHTITHTHTTHTHHTETHTPHTQTHTQSHTHTPNTHTHTQTHTHTTHTNTHTNTHTHVPPVILYQYVQQSINFA